MLNIFPILFLAPLAHFLLRVCVGAVFLRLGIRRFREVSMISVHPFKLLFRIFALLECIAGFLFILGAYTQIGALLGMFFATLHIFFPRAFEYQDTLPRMLFALLFFTSLSIFITGAGAFAFDLPI